MCQIWTNDMHSSYKLSNFAGSIIEVVITCSQIEVQSVIEYCKMIAIFTMRIV